MIEDQLPSSVVSRDRQLTASVEGSTLTLAQLRWEWTLNERNPNRVSMREYGRQVGRDNKQIRVYAHAYELTRRSSIPISEALARAQLGADSYAAAEAIAEVRGTTVQTVRRIHAGEMRDVREEARARAERNGTSVLAEVRDVARRRHVAAQREEEQHRQRVGRTVLRTDVAASRLVSARRNVLDAIQELQDVELIQVDVAVLDDRLDKLEAAVGLMRARVRGESGVDWDAGLRELLEVG